LLKQCLFYKFSDTCGGELMYAPKRWKIKYKKLNDKSDKFKILSGFVGGETIIVGVRGQKFQCLLDHT
jgi:hypothetical protein